MIASFCFSIPELSIKSKYIKIDTNSCNSTKDLKKAIASYLQLPSEYLQIDNPPKKELKNIDNYYEFQLSLLVRNCDINICILGDYKIKIKNCSFKRFPEIFPYIDKKGIFFSQECIQNNIRLFHSEKEIPLSGFPFLTTDNSNPYEITLKNNQIIILHYCGIHFILCDGERIFEAESLIEKAFPSFKISVSDSSGYCSILHSKEHYDVKVYKSVKFINYERSYSYKFIDVNLKSKISSVKKKISI